MRKRRIKRSLRRTINSLGFESIMRAVMSFCIFIGAMVFIYWLMGVFQVIEQLTIGVAILGATLIMFVPLFIWNLITNTATRNSPLFKLNFSEQANRGHKYDGLPDVGPDFNWQQVYVYMESKQPTCVERLQLRIGRRKPDAHEWEKVALKGDFDHYQRFYYFKIPASTQYGRQKAEIVAITSHDDYGTGEFTIRQ